jgi:hypothetical protein
MQRGAVWYAAELRNTSSRHAPWWAALPPRQPLLVTIYTFPEEYQHLLSSPDWVRRTVAFHNMYWVANSRLVCCLAGNQQPTSRHGTSTGLHSDARMVCTHWSVGVEPTALMV